MGDSFEQANGILSITQKLNFFKNISQKLNNFEMGEYQHYYFSNFGLMIRRVQPFYDSATEKSCKLFIELFKI